MTTTTTGATLPMTSARAAGGSGDLHQVTKLRWAVRVVLSLSVTASIAANVLQPART